MDGSSGASCRISSSSGASCCWMSVSSRASRSGVVEASPSASCYGRQLVGIGGEGQLKRIVLWAVAQAHFVVDGSSIVSCCGRVVDDSANASSCGQRLNRIVLWEVSLAYHVGDCGLGASCCEWRLSHFVLSTAAQVTRSVSSDSSTSRCGRQLNRIVLWAVVAQAYRVVNGDPCRGRQLNRNLSRTTA